jgi:hypothetical protein
MLTCLFSREMGRNIKIDSIAGILSSSQYLIVKNERIEDKLCVNGKKEFFFSKIATAI